MRPATFAAIALAGLLGWQLQASAAPRPAGEQTDRTRAAEPGENTSSVDSGYRIASEQTGVDTNYRAG
jgi:hypothetical protein